MNFSNRLLAIYFLKSVNNPIKFHFLSLLVAAFLFSGCSPKSRIDNSVPETPQYESPEPGDVPPEELQIQPINQDLQISLSHLAPLPDAREYTNDYNIIRVKVFPIDTPPAQDPYPKTTNRSRVYVRNYSQFKIYDKNKNLKTTATTLLFDTQTQTVEVDSVVHPLEELTINPNVPSSHTLVSWDKGIGQFEYNGAFSFTQINSSWVLINHLTLNDYLISVVPSEMPTRFEIEALKAQAVAARTYALYHAASARQVLKRLWDVDPTTRYQSYQGTKTENIKTTQAVIETNNQFLTYNNSIIEAFFSANSGGYTCSVSECFGGADRPYLIGQKDVEGVKNAPGGTWEKVVTMTRAIATLKKMMVEKLFNPFDHDITESTYSHLTVQNTGPTGRVMSLGLNKIDKSRVDLDAKQTLRLRRGLGFKTNLYNLETVQSDGSQLAVGHGLGHGVGMSQWGAELLARSGKTVSEILNFYYPGTQF